MKNVTLFRCDACGREYLTWEARAGHLGPEGCPYAGDGTLSGESP